MQDLTDTRLTVTVPADLKRHLKVSAAENDRTLSGEIVHALKKGSGWKAQKETAAEASSPN